MQIKSSRLLSNIVSNRPAGKHFLKKLDFDPKSEYISLLKSTVEPLCLWLNVIHSIPPKKIGLFLAFWDFVTERQHWRKFQFIKFLNFPFLMINEVSKLSFAWWTSNWSNFSELENLNFGTIQFPHSTWFTWHSIHIVIFILTWAFATPMHHNAI